jgi:hypothetical protein
LGFAVELDGADALPELAALGGETKMVDGKTGVSVGRVDGVFERGGRQGENGEQGEQKGFEGHGQRSKMAKN